MISRFVAVASFVLLAVGAALPASADTASSAQELFDKGQAQYAEGAYAEALVSLEASLQLVKDPETILVIAHCLRLLGRDADALERYGVYLAEWEQQHPGERSPHAEEVEGHVAALQERIRKQEAEEAAARKRKEQQEEQRQRAAEAQRRRREQERRARLAKRQQQQQRVIDRRKRILRIAIISGAAATASSVFAGGVFYATANSSRYNESFDSARNISTTAFVFAGIFGAAAATSSVLYILTRRRDKPSAPGAAAAVGPLAGGAAVTAALRF